MHRSTFHQDSSSKCISKRSVLAAKSCKANARDITVIPFVWGRNTYYNEFLKSQLGDNPFNP